MLNLINATVSHEMRNPLNSIVSQNTVNETIISELIQMAAKIKENEVKKKFLEVLS
jgi:signal transduction histidine kinase